MTGTDRDYFEPDLVDRVKARAAHYAAKIRALIGFHSDFQRAFLGEDGALRPEAMPMLERLAAFCFADASTFHPDQSRSDANAGRREVWLLIEQGLRLDRKQLDTLKRRQQELEKDDD